MTYEVDVNGRTRTIGVEKAAGDSGGLRIFVDGKRFVASVRMTDLGVLLIFEDGRVVDAAVAKEGPRRWLVALPRGAVVVAIDDRRRGVGGRQAAAGEQRVLAPMPGRVVRVLVQPGDEVAAGMGLVVVEAMKMENELTALRAGRVKTVGVREGEPIESGRVLVVIE